MRPVVKFVTTHRLDSEKGRDLILNWLGKELGIMNSAFGVKTAPYRIEFDIFGDGKLRSEVEALAKKYPENIRYHGFVPIHEIYVGKMDYDFVLMPSLFLETFGLSALDFAQFGIPTIGYKKGGLRQFISDYLDIGSAPGSGPQEQFDNAMKTILTNYTIFLQKKEKDQQYEGFTIDKDKVISIYGIAHRVKRFENIIG